MYPDKSFLSSQHLETQRLLPTYKHSKHPETALRVPGGSAHGKEALQQQRLLTVDCETHHQQHRPLVTDTYFTV